MTLYLKDGTEASVQEICREVTRLTFRDGEEPEEEREALCVLAVTLLDYVGGWQEADLIYSAIRNDLIDEQQEWLAKELLPIALNKELDK